jgi:N-methylhydantoinase A
MNFDELASMWSDMCVSGLDILRGEGLSDDDASFSPSLDMRYMGQWYELSVPFSPDTMGSPDEATLAEAFGAMHDRLFGYRTDDMPIDVLNVRLSVVGRTPKPTMNLSDGILESGNPQIGTRPMWSTTSRSMVDVGVFDGRRMGPGATITGPAVVELGTTSIVVPDDFDLVVDDAGSFVSILRERADQVRKSLEGLTATPVRLN